MATATVLRRPTSVNWPDVLAAVAATILSVGAVLLVAVQDDGGAAASCAVLLMTVPVAYARRAPLAAAFTLVVGAPLNALVFGSMVRCGATLPAAFIVAFLVGNHTDGRRRTAALTAVLVSTAVQCPFDPKLGTATIVLMVPVCGGFGLAGAYVQSRRSMVAALREQNRQLRERRAETAKLAVAADRTRIGSDLGPALRERISEIDRLIGRPAPDFAAIELAGRSILDSMREVVGVLRDAPTAPEASLDELPDLLARDTLADARLEIEGDRRTLPATVELTAYRVVEHALTALRDDADAQINVLVRYGADRLELRLSGPPADVDPRSVRSVVRARLALYGGSVDIEDSDGIRVASGRLPLVSPHA